MWWQSFCLFLNMRDARTCYTHENDSLDGERIIWKKKGTKEEQSPWGGARGDGSWSQAKRLVFGRGKVFFFVVTRRNKEMGTDSVGHKNLVVGRGSNFLVKISIFSMMYESRSSAEVEKGRGFEESVWMTVWSVQWGSRQGVYASYLVHTPLPSTPATCRASVGWGLCALLAVVCRGEGSVWVRGSRGDSCLPGSLFVPDLQSKTLLEICLQHFVIHGRFAC